MTAPDFNITPRPQMTDGNKQAILGGSSVEIQVLTCTVSNLGAMHFSEIPKTVIFQSRSGLSDIEFVYGTNTVPVTASGDFFTLRHSNVLALNCASTGPYYFRAASASTTPVMIGLALL